MSMGAGLLLIAVGAILRFAVQDSWEAVDLPTVGLILMIVGAVAFVAAAIYTFGRGGPRQGQPPPPTPRSPQ